MSSSRATTPSTLTISPFTTSLLSGALAGTTVDLSLYPLDTLKTRLQSASSFRAAGGFSGIYAGVGSAIVGSAPGAALFFVTYEQVKACLASRRLAQLASSGATREDEGEGGDWTLPVEHMLAASAGEVAACAVRVPTEVVKQRAQAGQHPSSLAALSSILAQREALGVAGVWRELYRGWSITVFREVPFTIIQFPLWEALKTYRLRSTGRDRDTISALESGIAGSAAGAVAAGITTPLDVLKTRMMLAREKTGMWALLTTILKESGPRAFLAGIGPRIMWISIGGAIFLGSYQWAYNNLQTLGRLNQKTKRIGL